MFWGTPKGSFDSNLACSLPQPIGIQYPNPVFYFYITSHLQLIRGHGIYQVAAEKRWSLSEPKVDHLETTTKIRGLTKYGQPATYDQ